MKLSTLVAAVFGSHQAQALPSYAIGNVSGNVTLANKLLSVVWSEENCESMKNGLHPDSLERVACPAVRFLARDGLLNDLFEKCGSDGDDVYGMDSESMKSLIGSGKSNYHGLGFDKVMTKMDGLILDESVLDRAFTDAIDGQAVESEGEDFLNVDQLELNFDHSASSGIIGTATNDDVHDTDNDDVNWNKYYEFLDKMCQCNSRDNGEYGDQLGPFTPEDVGRAVNHFGKAIEDENIRESTDVGAFSWGILAFEWANTFVSFQKNGVLPIGNFIALFFPMGPSGIYEMDRDIITDHIWLGHTLCEMNIQISSAVKTAMDESLAEHDCATAIDGPNGRAKTQCKIHGLLTDICGEGYANCLEGDHSNCPSSPLKPGGETCNKNSECQSNWCFGFWWTKRCVHFFVKPDPDDLPYCEDDNVIFATERFLSEGTVVHYDDATHTAPRAEVVSAIEAALEGSQNFEVQTDLGGKLIIQDVTRNGLALSSTNLTEDFTVANAFVSNYPGVEFDVICPAASDVCGVTVPDPQQSSPQPMIGSCVLKEDSIPKECLDEEYDMNLYVVNGPHFMLGASTEGKCPNVALMSREGGKHRIKFSSADAFGIPSYSFGKKVALGDFLKAEVAVPPIDEEGFSLESNSCVHYAGSIWRELGYTETHELAQFVVSNVANDPKFENMAKTHAGGLRYLAAKAVGGKSAMVSHLEEVVYSQMIIE